MSTPWQHAQSISLSRRLRHSRSGRRVKIITLVTLAIVTALLLLLATAVKSDVAISVNIAPPALPVYEQPPLPAPGYLWTPGYWSYGPEGYFWVPGTWIWPPAPGLVWTPGYWSWADGAYVWNPGYWAPVVGFYGGIAYGYGYPGHGYYGGEWRHGQFFYNSAVNNVQNVQNVYTRTVVNNVTVNNVSYNGGPGGVSARPTPQEAAAAHQPHQGPTAVQSQHVAGARAQHGLLASVNHGKPPIAATARPNSFSGAGAPSAATARTADAPTPSARSAPQAPPQHPTRLAQAPAGPRPAPPQERPAPQQRPAPAPQAQPHERPSEPPRRAEENPRSPQP
jgi:WXXGXW repeat (2 copies)